MHAVDPFLRSQVCGLSHTWSVIMPYTHQVWAEAHYLLFRLLQEQKFLHNHIVCSTHVIPRVENHVQR